MQKKRVLIVEDDASLRTSLFRLLDRKGFQPVTASCKREAEVLGRTNQKIDMVLVDLSLPDGNGLDLIKDLKAHHPGIKIIVLTGSINVQDAVRATKFGATEFITKPFELDELMTLIDSYLERESLASNIGNSSTNGYGFDNIIGQSQEIRQVLKFITQVADTDSTILISGESGTGKELVAKAIHNNSAQSNNAFVPINCGAIPRELLESELFGHVKGAFTGAIANRTGRFELAKNGTMFLDEIGDMNPALQVKLLRVLQDKKFEPVGGTKTVESNARVITATHMDLEKAVEKGLFREDLFYRLNVIPIHIPSLKERKSDIPLLVNYCIERFNKAKKKNLSGISSEALEVLMDYSWPGNIRELENLIERTTILKGAGLLEVDDLPEKYLAGQQRNSPTSDPVDVPESGMDFNSAVDNYENALILKALEKTGWNRNQAAVLLRLNRTTLVEKIKKKGLRPPEVSA